jgi:hypothetical protein
VIAGPDGLVEVDAKLRLAAVGEEPTRSCTACADPRLVIVAPATGERLREPPGVQSVIRFGDTPDVTTGLARVPRSLGQPPTKAVGASRHLVGNDHCIGRAGRPWWLRARARDGEGMGFWRSWFVWVTLGETLGFCAPAFAGAVTAGGPAGLSVAALLAAGAVEGAVLGWAQAHVLRRSLPGLPAARWVGATSAAAVVAYLIGLAPSTFDFTALPTWAQVVAGAIGGTALLLSIGTAQWLVLRRFVAHAAHWIWITAVAWLAGLTAFMVITPPLWHEGQPLPVTILVGAFAGLVMAATVAAVSGVGLVRFLGLEALIAARVTAGTPTAPAVPGGRAGRNRSRKSRTLGTPSRWSAVCRGDRAGMPRYSGPSVPAGQP